MYGAAFMAFGITLHGTLLAPPLPGAELGVASSQLSTTTCFGNNDFLCKLLSTFQLRVSGLRKMATRSKSIQVFSLALRSARQSSRQPSIRQISSSAACSKDVASQDDVPNMRHAPRPGRISYNPSHRLYAHESL